MYHPEAGEYEAGQAKAAIRACVATWAKQIMRSTFHDAEVAPHVSSKNKGEHYRPHPSTSFSPLHLAVTQWATAEGYPVTSLYASHSKSDLLKLGLLKSAGDGTFTLNVPPSDDCPLPSFDVEQTGGWVMSILRDPKKYLGHAGRCVLESDTCRRGGGGAVRSVGQDDQDARDLQRRVLPRRDGDPEDGARGYLLELPGVLRSTWSCCGVAACRLTLLSLRPRDVKKSKKVHPEHWDMKALTWDLPLLACDLIGIFGQREETAGVRTATQCRVLRRSSWTSPGEPCT
jgi:hypothetical protein